MRVHWKRLCCLGILFWVCMSGYDYYNGSILVPGEFAKSDLNKVAEGQKEAQFLHSFQTGENLETEWSFWTYALTFLTTNIILVLAVLSRKYYPKRLQTTNEIIATNMAIRAALMDNIDDNTENIVIIHENKYDACPMHKYKAKDENIELMSATKEVVSLNKKLEGLNEEKRNLTRFLAQSEKDNRIIKQKMMEVLRDKNVLLKRLEAATREIRSNTVARQATLGKLEESIQCSNQFKQQIQQMSAEKSELLRRLRQSEAQLKTLRRQTDNKSVNSKSSYNGIKLTSHPKPVDSTKDIEQIEMKLHDLEASLEKMKCKSSEKNEDFESEDNDDTSDSEPKILRQVSSSDMNFLSEVEPSYTNLLGKFDCEPGAGGQQHHQIVESIASAVVPYYDKQHKFAVTNTFGSALFNILKLIQKQHSECINVLVRPRDPVSVNYTVVCNYKCPCAERFATNYFGARVLKRTNCEEEHEQSGCQAMVKYALPRNIL